jgi:transposase
LAAILNQIYEEDFMGFSCGFRPGRSQHQALDALWVGIMRKKVNWVLDADIRGFFDNMSHEWTMKFVEHRVADRRVLRLIRRWLRAGVSEEGNWSNTEVGTPQGAVISPLLANIYLHCVFDLWVQHWRKHQATGDMIVVRYADDIVAGFENGADAERFLSEWKERMQKFGLELHPDKTRLIEFGRHAMDSKCEDPASASECALRRHSSKVGAVCSNSARTDLCGGRRETDVPTAAKLKIRRFGIKQNRVFLFEAAMRGKDFKQSAMFSYLSPEERVPADHPLRPVRRMVDAALKALSPSFGKMYSITGRPSIPPEQLLRALLLQVLYTVRSERMLMEQLEYNLLFRWFVGLNMDEPVWVPTVFSKNRDRLLAGDIAEKFFAQVLSQAREADLLSDEHFT